LEDPLDREKVERQTTESAGLEKRGRPAKRRKGLSCDNSRKWGKIVNKRKEPDKKKKEEKRKEWAGPVHEGTKKRGKK
jgi:hypothetical protein